ncbi:hypothetical protein [Brevundimonas sp.]|uniref:hypothetical protein n=1 Tax=Brevundimonas sp. TaxID=1871086 RepID=UPI003BA95F1C
MTKYIKPIIVGFVVAFVISGGISFMVASAGGSAGWLPAFIGGFIGVFTAYIMANLAGNRAGRAAQPAQQEAALNLRPEPGRAMLIVFREGFVGMAAGMNVSVDGRVVAQLKSPRFTAIPLDVGRHEMQLAFGALAGAQNRAGVEEFGVGAGEVVAYRATVSMGALKNSVALERITPDATLTAKLKAMKMVAPEVG